MKTYYVSLFWRWNSRAKRWVTTVGTGEDQPYLPEVPDNSLIAAYEVQCLTKAEAPAVVMEWLHSQRPSSTPVKQLWPKPASRHVLGYVIAETGDDSNWTFVVGPFATREDAERHMEEFDIKDGTVRRLVKP